MQQYQFFTIYISTLSSYLLLLWSYFVLFIYSKFSVPNFFVFPSNGWKPLTILAKSSILDVWQGSDNASNKIPSSKLEKDSLFKVVNIIKLLYRHFFFAGSVRGSKFIIQVQLSCEGGSGGKLTEFTKKLQNLIYLSKVPSNSIK